MAKQNGPSTTYFLLLKRGNNEMRLCVMREAIPSELEHYWAEGWRCTGIESGDTKRSRRAA